MQQGRNCTYSPLVTRDISQGLLSEHVMLFFPVGSPFRRLGTVLLLCGNERLRTNIEQ